jgi:hypothetical protein
MRIFWVLVIMFLLDGCSKEKPVAIKANAITQSAVVSAPVIIEKMEPESFYRVAIGTTLPESAPLAQPRTNFRRYVQTYDCPQTTLQVHGTKCLDENNCAGLANMTDSEQITFVNKGKTTQTIELSKQFPHSNRVDPLRVYALSEVFCLANNKIAVVYSGGGNCDSVCEVGVYYEFTQQDEILGTVRNNWNDKTEKHFSVDEQAQHTQWLDAEVVEPPVTTP